MAAAHFQEGSIDYSSYYERAFDNAYKYDSCPRGAPAYSHYGSEVFMRIDGSRALAAGLRLRPLTETARDVLASLGTGGEPPASGRARRAAGLDPALAARLLTLGP